MVERRKEKKKKKQYQEFHDYEENDRKNHLLDD